MDKSSFSVEDLSNLESLEILGGATAGTMGTQVQCTNTVIGCNCTNVDNSCTNNSSGCACDTDTSEDDNPPKEKP